MLLLSLICRCDRMNLFLKKKKKNWKIKKEEETKTFVSSSLKGHEL